MSDAFKAFIYAVLVAVDISFDVEDADISNNEN